MKFLNRTSRNIVLLLMASAIFFTVETADAIVEKSTYVCDAEGNREIKTTLELKVAKKKYKKRKREIKRELQKQHRELKIRLVFFPFLDPPMNLGIGKCVSAEEGRLAILRATEFNGGVDRVIMQEFMPHHWIKIGATDLAELTFIPITPEDLVRLSDPSLSTKEFQNLYRELAALRERKLPFGMGIRKIEVDDSK